MRLIRITAYEQKMIKSLVKKHFGGDADVYVFGSRVDENKKGGDIDLYITAEMPPPEIVRSKISLLVDLEKTIGEQKIDIVVNNHSKQKSIFEIAENQGVKL